MWFLRYGRLKGAGRRQENVRKKDLHEKDEQAYEDGRAVDPSGTPWREGRETPDVQVRAGEGGAGEALRCVRAGAGLRFLDADVDLEQHGDGPALCREQTLQARGDSFAVQAFDC